MKKILAISSSRVGNSGYLDHAAAMIKQFLGDEPLNIAFIPFAAVQNSYENYFQSVRQALNELPYKINLVLHENAKEVIENADVIMTGGGNTFKLLHDIYSTKTLDIIRDRVTAGVPYIGWSAGSNILCPGIYTTNDMPVIEPKSFNALGLFPFQINPHYINEKPAGHNGETRDERLLEFMKVNPGISVVGLPEGTALLMQRDTMRLIGEFPAILFHAQDHEQEPHRREIKTEGDLSFLL